MEILQFVKVSDVDPIFFETSYFSVPEEAGRRGYTLLLKTMEDMKVAALAQVTMHQRERTVILRPYRNGLTLHTLYYPNEIHDVAGYGKNNATNLKKPEIALAEQFAKGLVAPFHPEKFHDEYQERVKKLIESKEKGTAAPKPEKHNAPRPGCGFDDRFETKYCKQGWPLKKPHKRIRQEFTHKKNRVRKHRRAHCCTREKCEC